MQALVITIHVIACIVLIVLVLLQSGKEDMGVIFGGGSGSVFGSSGAGGLLVKITAVLAGIFLITSLTYNYISGTQIGPGNSLMLEGDGIITPAPEKEEPKGVSFETTNDTTAVTVPAENKTAEPAKQDGTKAEETKPAAAESAAGSQPEKKE